MLVVDDNLDSADSLALQLELAGHEAMTAHDGQTAVLRAREFAPDLVLFDIGLPLMDEYDNRRAKRDLPGGTAILIVALTGWGQPSDRERTAQAGFDGHIVKPVEYDAIAALLQNT